MLERKEILMDIHCRNPRCLEPWEDFYVLHEMEEEERKLFLSGRGCPSCHFGHPEHILTPYDWEYASQGLRQYLSNPADWGKGDGKKLKPREQAEEVLLKLSLDCFTALRVILDFFEKYHTIAQRLGGEAEYERSLIEVLLSQVKEYVSQDHTLHELSFQVLVILDMLEEHWNPPIEADQDAEALCQFLTDLGDLDEFPVEAEQAPLDWEKRENLSASGQRW